MGSYTHTHARARSRHTRPGGAQREAARREQSGAGRERARAAAPPRRPAIPASHARGPRPRPRSPSLRRRVPRAGLRRRRVLGERVPRGRRIVRREHARAAVRARHVRAALPVYRLLRVRLRAEVRGLPAQRRPRAQRHAEVPAAAAKLAVTLARTTTLRVRVQRATTAAAAAARVTEAALRVRSVERVRAVRVPVGVVCVGGEGARGGVAGAEAARHADHVARGGGHGAGLERLEGHGVVQLQAVRGHRRAAAGVEHGRGPGRARGEGRRGRRARRGAVCGCEDAPARLEQKITKNNNNNNSAHECEGDARRGATDVDHPVGDLAHAEAGGVAELLFLLLAGVRVVRVAVEPVLEKVGDGLGELAALAGRALDEARRRLRLRGAGRGVGGARAGTGGSGGHARGGGGGRGGVRRRAHRVVGCCCCCCGEGPLLALGLDARARVLAGDAGDAAKEVLLGHGAAEGRVAEGVVVLGRAGCVSGGGAGAHDAGGPVVCVGCERGEGEGGRAGEGGVVGAVAVGVGGGELVGGEAGGGDGGAVGGVGEAETAGGTVGVEGGEGRAAELVAVVECGRERRELDAGAVGVVCPGVGGGRVGV